MKYIACLLGLLLLASCSNFLDLDNPNKKTDQSFWKTQEDLESGVAAIYNSLVEESPSGYWCIATIQVKECRTENFQSRNDVQGRFAISTYKNTPSTDVSAKIFRSLYIGIFRANQVIHYASQVQNIEEKKRNELVGEAKFLRGLNYLHLAMEFGDAPIITKLIADQAEYFTPKSPKEEVWKQAMSDFEEAKKYLPDTYPATQTGRATKGAATAYLGKAYLHQGEWAKAEQEFKHVVDNEQTYGYGLLDNYSHLFDGLHENSKEAVFEIQFSLEGGPDIWTDNPAMRTRATTIAQECAPGEVGGWFELYPTKTLLNAFMKEKTADGSFDPRALTTIAWNYPGCEFYTHNFVEKFGAESVWLRKNQNWWNKDEGDWKSTLDEYAMRYADVLLMLAESYTMQGKVSLAAPLVHRVRERAKLQDKSALMATWSKESMMEEIMHQRNLEFAREGIHFYDLRRWGTLEKVIRDSKEEGYANYTPRYEYYPIPEQELLNNPNITQNEGWK